MAEALPGRLIRHAENAERMRDRYSYRGNAKYPRAFPCDYWRHFDAMAKDLRRAAEILHEAEVSA
ncbi:hypothetical protein [Devosia sp. Naph2]|uniref:hypothetical protein n=1 Tax=Devosia polycyclovorans TaxID=3345148 RepID=UPI0035D04C86